MNIKQFALLLFLLAGVSAGGSNQTRYETDLQIRNETSSGTWYKLEPEFSGDLASVLQNEPGTESDRVLAAVVY